MDILGKRGLSPLFLKKAGKDKDGDKWKREYSGGGNWERLSWYLISPDLAQKSCFPKHRVIVPFFRSRSCSLRCRIVRLGFDFVASCWSCHFFCSYHWYLVKFQVFLQLLILLTGNYNFFNLLTIVLCMSLLDDKCILSRIQCFLCKRCVRSSCLKAANQRK